MVRESQIESARISAKGKKPAYTFKKKGNEIQSAFIDKVTEQVASATARMERVMAADESGAAHLARAKEDLEEGIKLLARRQKMIKFADRSDAGWAVVEEYEDDALASNSEDERKMEKAERAAERKVAKKRKLKESKTREEAAKKGGLRPSTEPLMAFAPVKPPMAPKPMAPKPSGGCFHCGELGHFRRECPKALASVPYPLPNVSEGLMAGESICERGKNVARSGGECTKELTPEIVACEALLEREFVNGAVSELQNGGYIEEAKEPPVVCSPLSVVMNGVGKKRLVVNLRHVNGFLWKQKFKYEDIRVAMAMFEKGEWMFSFDLKSGYHHVDVAQQYRKYLGFEWGGVTYTFVVLPFGLSSAPYVFTKMMRPLVRLWRSKGIKAIVYLDDGIVSSQNESSAKASSAWVRDTLDRAGWVCNEAKSVWVPTHELVWLGFNLNLSKGSISVPEGKVRALQHSLKVAVKTSSLLAKTVASLIGRIISMSLALGPVARFRTRALYALLESRQAWCDILLITQDAGEELRFWVECFDQFNSQPIWHSPAANMVCMLHRVIGYLMKLCRALRGGS
eukprot:Em0008g725a